MYIMYLDSINNFIDSIYNPIIQAFSSPGKLRDKIKSVGIIAFSILTVVLIIPMAYWAFRKVSHKNELSETESKVDQLSQRIIHLPPIDLTTINDKKNEVDNVLESLDKQHIIICQFIQNLKSKPIKEASELYAQGLKTADEALALANQILQSYESYPERNEIRNRRTTLTEELETARNLSNETDIIDVKLLTDTKKSIEKQIDELIHLINDPIDKLKGTITALEEIRSVLELVYQQRQKIESTIVAPLMLEINKLTEFMNAINQETQNILPNMTHEQVSSFYLKLSEAQKIYTEINNNLNNESLNNYQGLKKELLKTNFAPVRLLLNELSTRYQVLITVYNKRVDTQNEQIYMQTCQMFNKTMSEAESQMDLINNRKKTISEVKDSLLKSRNITALLFDGICDQFNKLEDSLKTKLQNELDAMTDKVNALSKYCERFVMSNQQPSAPQPPASPKQLAAITDQDTSDAT